jgi:hypothetical protein
MQMRPELDYMFQDIIEVNVFKIDYSENLFFYTTTRANGQKETGAKYISDNGVRRYHIFNFYGSPWFVRIPSFE